MIITPTHDNSLLKDKLPYLNPNNVSNTSLLTDGLVNVNTTMNTGNSITYDLGKSYFITHYVASFGSPSLVMEFYDKDNNLLIILNRTTATTSYTPSEINGGVGNVRYVKIVNNSTSSSSLSELNVWGYIEYLNKFLILSNDNILSIKNSELYSTVPKMTSNTSSEGEIIYSTFASAYYPYNAFDKDTTTTRWQASSTKGFIGYKFKNKIKIVGYKIVPVGQTNTLNPKNFRLEASDNGSTWEILDSRVGVVYTSGEGVMFNIINQNEYLYYRLNILENSGNPNYTGVRELEFFAYDNNKLVTVNDTSEENFITHGLDKSTEIDLIAQLTNKVFIEQNSTTLGIGKVFSTTIDTTKTPIKKVSIN